MTLINSVRTKRSKAAHFLSFKLLQQKIETTAAEIAVNWLPQGKRNLIMQISTHLLPL
jgi:hypothetical protein